MKAVAEAPSKAILTGEHFVVHGAWALAAALPRRVRVEVEPSSTFGASYEGSAVPYPEEGPFGRVVEAVAKEGGVSPKVRVAVSSSVPVGAGMGSSASTMVALVAALSRLYALRLGVEEVIRLSMVGELEVHGKPSGIDPAVCAIGGAILFKPGSKPRRLRIKGKRSLVISYSGISRSTRGQIGRVAEVKERLPGLFASLAGSIGGLSLDAADRLVQGDMEGLGRLLTINHAALSFVGVSNDTLDRMVDAMVSLGAYGAKLTGGGGGGSVVAVAPEAKEKRIVSALSARGFETFSARIPAEGVKSWLKQ
jgi:mevalonate kinase